MIREQVRIKCAIMRGGTSKAIFLMKNELPKHPTARDKVILAIFGSPDVRQIDGLGGADPLTSKLAIIGPPTRVGSDVDYTFGQVSINESSIDYGGLCGNISAAVGPFAIDEGFVAPQEPITKVRIHNTNYDRMLVAEVPVLDGKACVEGDYEIHGVPGTGAKIRLDFSDTAGTSTGKMLPTGKTKEVLDVKGIGEIEVSILDVANPFVFCRAEDLGLKGTETPQQIDSNPKLLQTLERIRGTLATLLGMASDIEKAVEESPAHPLVGFVSRPADYLDYITGKTVKAEDIDLVARMMFMQITHKAYPVTGTACTGAAIMIPGTIVNEMVSDEAKKRLNVRIGHPAGIINVETNVEKRDKELILTRAAVGRTARRIMDGYVYVRSKIFYG